MKNHKLIALALILATIGLLATLFAINYQSTAEGSGKDPIDGANVKMMNVQIYQPMHGYGQLTIDTAFIKKDQTYVRIASDATTFLVYCYYGATWGDDKTNAGCLGNRGFEHQDYISVLPYYTGGYITSWNVEAGGYVIATITPDQGQFYLFTSTTLLE